MAATFREQIATNTASVASVRRIALKYGVDVDEVEKRLAKRPMSA
jgi:hypothetical protein